MNLEAITPVILTLDEEPNIERTLGALSWARQIVVVDSLSRDATTRIAAAHPNVRVVQRAFDQHALQWNHAIEATGIDTEWILALDADYVVSAGLVQELRELAPEPAISGYRTRFVYCVGGRALRGSIYPPVTTLFRRGSARYLQDGHTQRLEVRGAVADLAAPILHDDRKPFGRWLASQDRYMALEAQKLETAPAGSLGLADRLRRLVIVAPALVFFHALFVKGVILDGWPGVAYALQRFIAELILSHHLVARRLARLKG